MDLTDDDNSYCIVSGKQLAIKGKKNINFFVGDKVLKLSDAFYVPGLTINLINTTRLWYNSIGIYFSTIWPMKVSYNGTIFAYTNNIRE